MQKACCLVSLLSMLAIIVGGAIGDEVPRVDRAAAGRGQPCVDVRDYGARGDGMTDDTDAIQRAVLDAASPPKRGKVCVPLGTYMIKADAPARWDCPDPPDGKAEMPCGVALLNGTHLRMDPGATLRAFPTAQGNYMVLRVWNQNNVTITGGTLLGERDEHILPKCVPGSLCWNGETTCPANGECPPGEWGFGIYVESSSNVSIEHVIARDFWGDGFYVASAAAGSAPSENVRVDRSEASRNRRNGMSLVSCVGCRVVESLFSNNQGTAPEAGIDIEPDQNNVVQNSFIKRCVFTHNQKGIQLARGNRAERSNVSGNRIDRNVAKWNEDGIVVHEVMSNWVTHNSSEHNNHTGILIRDTDGGPVENMVRGNVVRLNGAHGIWIDGSSGNLVEENLVFGNAEEGISVDGQATEIVRNIAVDNSPDLVDTQEDCDDNRWAQNVFRTSRAGATEHPACIQ